LHGRRLHDLDAALRELAAGGLDVVACERAVEERADAVFLAFGREQHDARHRMRNAELNPALARAHRLVGRDREAEFLGIELERALRVAHGNADELDVSDHGVLDPLRRVVRLAAIIAPAAAAWYRSLL
jgi:hypothetical protein